MKAYYTHHLTGEEIVLLEIYDSYGEKYVLYETEEGEQEHCSLIDFEEIIEELVS